MQQVEIYFEHNKAGDLFFTMKYEDNLIVFTKEKEKSGLDKAKQLLLDFHGVTEKISFILRPMPENGI